MTTTLVDLRTMVRERLRLSSQDPMFPDATVNRQINIAYGNITSVEPNGWWFQHVEETVVNGAAEAPTFPVHLATPNNARLIRKVMYVFVSLDGNYWLPVPRRERTDQIRLAGGRRAADGIPLCWSVLTQPTTISTVKSSIALVFDPPLPGLASVRFGCSVGPPDLTVDASQLQGVPALFVDPIVEGAVTALLRQRRGAAGAAARRALKLELVTAKTAYDEWVRALRVYFNTPAAGPGYTTVRPLP